MLLFGGAMQEDAISPNGADMSSSTEYAGVQMIKAAVRDLLAQDKTFNYLPSLDDEAGLIDAGVVDSFSLIVLVVKMETEFSIRIDPGEVTDDRFYSVSSIANYVKVKRDGDRGG